MKGKIGRIVNTYREFFRGIRRFFQFLKPYRKYGYMATFFMAISVLLEIPMPFLTMYLIDYIIPRKSLKILNLIVLGLLIVLLIRAFSMFYYRLNLVKYKTWVIFDVRKRLVEKLMGLPYLNLKELSPGYMVSRIDGDVDQLEGIMAETFINLLKDFVTFLVGIGILFFINVKMAISALLLLPFFIYTMHHYGVKLNKLMEVLREKWAEFTKVIEEMVEGGISLKGKGKEKWGIVKFCKSHVSALKQDIKTDITGAVSGIVLDMVGSLAPLVILWLGIREIICGNLTIGEFFAFNSFLMYLYGPISNLVNTNVDIHSTLASADRVFEILDWEEEEWGDAVMDRVNGNIVFNRVTYCYSDEKKFYFDFEIKSGEKVAIVGENGSGKSTILKLIMGYLKGFEGEILIDGRNMREIDMKSFRKRVGYVGSENFIFSGTFFENISLSIFCDEKKLWEAISIADLESLVDGFDMGVREKIGRSGRKLSTGEIQRILIGRAVFNSPDILIFDEATSQVDLISEKRIYENIFSRFHKNTVIVVSHRVEPLRGFDRIFYVEGGRIVEEGKFDELMEREGKFFMLYNSRRSSNKIMEV